MKKFNQLKTIQLIVFGAFSIAAFIFAFYDKDMREALQIPAVHSLRVLLWFTLAAGFIFIYFDYTLLKKVQDEFGKVEEDVVTDQLSKIANRVSLDNRINEYAEKGLPEKFSCVMLKLANIRDINNDGRAIGDEALKNFASILNISAGSSNFLGRNGGDNYLAFFEDGDKQNLREFIAHIREQVMMYNGIEGHANLEVLIGIARHYDHPELDIHQLIALAAKNCSTN